jgi:hypothetical protein
VGGRLLAERGQVPGRHRPVAHPAALGPAPVDAAANAASARSARSALAPSAGPVELGRISMVAR